jgi:hypothetical protein
LPATSSEERVNTSILNGGVTNEQFYDAARSKLEMIIAPGVISSTITPVAAQSPEYALHDQ